MTRPTTTRTRAALLACLAAAAIARPTPATADELKRAGFFGAAVAPRPAEAGPGVAVREVFPGSAAAEAGIEPGDVITAVDGMPLADTAGFVARLGRRKAGDSARVAFRRGDDERTKDVTLKPRPVEPGTDAYDVLYDSVPSRGGRLRTITTRPKAPGRHPALFVIQGLGGFSIENAGPAPAPYAEFINDFARRGYVTLRVDKPGQGDSEGGPTRDVAFEAELDGYRAALRALLDRDFVDRDNVLIFGHSMGGAMGPLIAAETPVKGIAAYGTVAKTWPEYLMENTRRQMALAGDSAAAIDEALRADAIIHYEVFVAGKAPEAVAAAHPALRGRVEESFDGGRYYSGRHHEFFRQLAARNLPAAWERFGGHALAIWGRSDFVSTEADHALIVEAVNRAHPGRGTFLALDGVDHGFHRAASPAESYRNRSGPGEFDPAVLAALRDWADRITGRFAPAK